MWQKNNKSYFIFLLKKLDLLKFLLIKILKIQKVKKKNTFFSQMDTRHCFSCIFHFFIKIENILVITFFFFYNSIVTTIRMKNKRKLIIFIIMLFLCLFLNKNREGHLRDRLNELKWCIVNLGILGLSNCTINPLDFWNVS